MHPLPVVSGRPKKLGGATRAYKAGKPLLRPASLQRRQPANCGAVELARLASGPHLALQGLVNLFQLFGGLAEAFFDLLRLGDRPLDVPLTRTVNDLGVKDRVHDGQIISGARHFLGSFLILA
jgi:hypothetical protein